MFFSLKPVVRADGNQTTNGNQITDGYQTTDGSVTTCGGMTGEVKAEAVGTVLGNYSTWDELGTTCWNFL